MTSDYTRSENEEIMKSTLLSSKTTITAYNVPQMNERAPETNGNPEVQTNKNSMSPTFWQYLF